MQREGRPAIAAVEIEVARERATRLDQLGHAFAPARPEAPRQGAEEGALVDHLEGGLGDGREDVAVTHAVHVHAELGARRRERLVAEVDADDVPATLGEERTSRAAPHPDEHASGRAAQATNPRAARAPFSESPGERAS